MVFSRILYAKMCRALDCFFLLYKKLSHIFRNLDTQFMILDCQFEKPKKTSKKTLSLIFYKNLLEITIEKIRPILKYKKFNGIRHCGCINCFEDYESFDSAFCNLVDKLSETLTLIDVMKTKKKDTFYLRRVSVILKKFQQEIGLA